ncbi:F0F1 ATP synthase subunit delta [Candidatus Babeliales bacterium]|nr:F0F1 ATP synthase subunit delta [Candidatus Babeliales bacterium]
MRYSQSSIAKQYAKAYMAEYGSLLQPLDIKSVQSIIRFFRRHHNFMSLINLLVESNKTENVVLDELFEQFALPQNLKKLIDVLIVHKRLILFAQVLQDICCLYFQINNILELTIMTAMPLENHELEKFENFFKKLSGKTTLSNVVHDSSLIAGVRMQSDLFLWEYSIAARLRSLHQKMLIEG